MIKIDIEMPETCNMCFACMHYDDVSCSLVKWPDNDVLDYAYNNTKPDWCPLKEAES